MKSNKLQTKTVCINTDWTDIKCDISMVYGDDIMKKRSYEMIKNNINKEERIYMKLG